MAKVTRRNFLKSSAAGAGVLICGTAATSRVFGANDRLRIAVAGVNGRGTAHISGWLEQPNVEIAYLIDPDQKVLDQKLKALEQEGPGQIHLQGRGRRPRGAGRQDARRHLHRHPEPLALADDDLGGPGRQARLRREADEPRHRRRPRRLGSAEEVRAWWSSTAPRAAAARPTPDCTRPSTRASSAS